ncbi:MAG: type VI secretion system tube protein Hcp [Planctomycetes bacterium]|nr:type VI secretion system tube protein Hcp [Planctomycetota bacterium]
MAFDAFLQIDKISGESQDERYEDSIEVLSFSWGVRQPSAGQGAGGRGERCDFDNFTFTKTVDRASPLLAMACASGKRHAFAQLVLHRATGEKQGYYGMELRDVVIASVRMEGDPKGHGGLPIETVSLSFSKIIWHYVLTDKQTGKPGGSVVGSWDLAANRLMTQSSGSSTVARGR